MAIFSVEEFKKLFVEKVKNVTAKTVEEASLLDLYNSLGILIWEEISGKWADYNKKLLHSNKKQVYYFCMEFLTGAFLRKNETYLGLRDVIKQGMKELGYNLEDIEDQERDPGLGNGGLGRLAACFLDSLASLGYAGHGTGIRYNYGLFEQKIIDGYQVEFPDKWLTNRNIWETKRKDKSCVVGFGGEVVVENVGGKLLYKTIHQEKVLAVPYDTPVVGSDGETINTLRLFSAENYDEDFDFFAFSEGDYASAFSKKHTAEAISQVLYPNDNYYEGRVLRLKQEYFLVSAGLQTIFRTYSKTKHQIKDFHKYIALHINDTHPSLVIPELMRLLIDVYGLGWDEAWDITLKSTSYTNHTILSEAMEKWEYDLMKKLLPRVLMIIEEIDRRFVIELSETYKLDMSRIDKVRIIKDGIIRMANLCIIGSSSVNGVAKLHTEILKTKELKDFYDIFPYKFNNKTNGITHRRWLILANPGLTNLIDESIGKEWQKEPVLMNKLEEFQNDKAFLEKLDQVKIANKQRLVDFVYKKTGEKLDKNTIFDMHSKRLHEYKRQGMNALHIMYLCNQIEDNPNIDFIPTTFFFAAKAAPGYFIAKMIIKLITSIKEKIDSSPLLSKYLKVVFLENYGVSIAEKMIPAADVSEQISTASKEASGTGNIKYMMNGALTIGTLDGANVEIKEAVGDDNIYIFGLTAEEVYQLNFNKTYHSVYLYEHNPHIKRVVDNLTNGYFKNVSDSEFQLLKDSLIVQNDSFFVLKDFDAYAQTHVKIQKDYANKELWLKKSLINIARSGVFSSDYTIKEYIHDIWNLNK